MWIFTSFRFCICHIFIIYATTIHSQLAGKLNSRIDTVSWRTCVKNPLKVCCTFLMYISDVLVTNIHEFLKVFTTVSTTMSSYMRRLFTRN